MLMSKYMLLPRNREKPLVFGLFAFSFFLPLPLDVVIDPRWHQLCVPVMTWFINRTLCMHFFFCHVALATFEGLIIVSIFSCRNGGGS